MGYDDQAQPITTTFADYVMPSATEVPRIEVKLAEFPSPLNPLGVKGVGESGCVPAAGAIISAVENALAPFGVRIGEYPMTPARLFGLLQPRLKTAPARAAANATAAAPATSRAR
jgi:carbon-monoxide dehydrogenase large subunit